MKKIVVLMMAMGMFGCASKSDLTALSVRADKLTLRVATLENDNLKLEQEVEKLQGESEVNSAKIGFLTQELKDNNLKLDRVFTKSIQK